MIGPFSGRGGPLIRPSRLVLLGVAIVAGVTLRAPAVAEEGPGAAAARADFVEVARVLLSPRCSNCHPAGEAPLQTDRAVPHAMNVTRTSARSGLPCSTCHPAQNTDFVGGPPGVPGWRLPPDETPMVFVGKTPTALCEQLKDPARNGHRTLKDLEEHMVSDPLVLWGWSPGPGRTLPPLSHEVFAGHVRRWVAAGGPCP
jgi:hypothetical protein